jgi:hypothetical protein
MNTHCQAAFEHLTKTLPREHNKALAITVAQGFSMATIPTLPTLNLHDPFESFQDTKPVDHVILAAPSNQLDMVDLRKVCHRAASVLSMDGRLHTIAHNPDLVLGSHQGRPWPGEWVDVNGSQEHYRPLRQHFELLRLFGFRLEVPRPSPKNDSPYLILSAVKEEVSITHIENSKNTELLQRCDEKYGAQSPYRRFNRLEEPEIVDDMLYGMHKMGLSNGDTVLGPGCNDGREFALFERMNLNGLRFIGLDAAPSSIEEARARFSDDQHQFHTMDIGELRSLSLKPVQGLLLLNVLQCTTVDRKQLLKDLKPLFDKKCAVLISIPNSHFLGTDVARRPISRKDPRHDRSLIMKDLRYLTRYFYRANFTSIECFGSYDAFLLARR